MNAKEKAHNLYDFINQGDVFKFEDYTTKDEIKNICNDVINSIQDRLLMYCLDSNQISQAMYIKSYWDKVEKEIKNL